MKSPMPFLLLALLAVALAPGTTEARVIRPRLYQMVSLSQTEPFSQVVVIIHGRVTSVGKTTAEVAISKVLSGKLEVRRIAVTPIQKPQCIRGPVPNFRPGEEVVLFVYRNAIGRQGPLELHDGWAGKWTVTPAYREDFLVAVEKLIEVFSVESEDSQHRAMLALARSENGVLRREALPYLGNRIGRSEHRADYQKELVALMDTADPELLSAAARAARRAEQGAFEAIVRASRHESMAIRAEAAFLLADIRRMEAKAALLALFKDEAPLVRTRAVGSYSRWLKLVEDRAPRPAELLPLLEDPSGSVRRQAAVGLGETGDPEVIAHLLPMLRRQDADDCELYGVMLALDMMDGGDDPRIDELLEAEVPLLIEVLKRKGLQTRYAAIILGRRRSPDARKALEWAAKHHPGCARSYARKVLGKLR